MQRTGSCQQVQSTREAVASDGASPLLPPSSGLSSVEADALLLEHGLNTLPLIASPPWRFLLQCCFRGPMVVTAWCVVLALALLTQRWISCLSMAAVLLFSGGASYWTVRRLQVVLRRVAEAQRQRPTAVVCRDGRWQQLPPSRLVPGDLVKLHAGSVVPADCTIDGVVEVNEAALTGESLPVPMGPESMPKMGSLIMQGEAHGTVQFTGSRTFCGRLLRILHSQRALPSSTVNAGKVSSVHIALTRVLFVSATAVAALGMLLGGFALGYRRVGPVTALEGLVLLAMVALPIGLESALTAVMAVGGWRLALREAVLPARLSSIACLASMDILFMDKTGTLTANTLELDGQCHLFGPSCTRESVLQLAALSVRWREPAVDPLDSIILGATDLNACDAYTQLDYTPFTPSTGRSEATVRSPDGAVFKVTKGIANTVLQLVCNKDKMRSSVERTMADLGRRGLRCIMVAYTTAEERRTGDQAQQRERDSEPVLHWQLAGIVAFLDPLRHDAAHSLKRLEACGISVKMITGDHPLITKEAAFRLGMANTAVATANDVFQRNANCVMPPYTSTGHSPGSSAAPQEEPRQVDATLGENYGAVFHSFSVFAGAGPQHKCLAVEVARQCGHTVGFLGDGINDAPALHHADVGVALMTEDCTDGLSGGISGGVSCDGGHDSASFTHREEEESERTALLAAAAETLWVEGFASGTAGASWAHTVADAVALTPSLHKVVDAVLRSRATLCVVETVLTFRLCSSLHLGFFLSLNPFIALCGEPSCADGTQRPLRLSPLLTALLAVCVLLLTALAAFDRPPPMQSLSHPHQLNVPAMLLAVVPVAFVGAAASLLMQWVLADSVSDPSGSWCHAVGIPPITAEYATAALYLEVALSTTLSFFSCRARPTSFCWLTAPSPPVGIAVASILAFATLLAAFLPGGDWEPALGVFGLGGGEDSFTYATGLAYSPDGAVRALLLWVWMWSLTFWWLQELTRVAVAAVMHRLNLLRFRESQQGNWPLQPSARDGGGPWQMQHDGGSAGFSFGAFGAVERRLLDC